MERLRTSSIYNLENDVCNGLTKPPCQVFVPGFGCGKGLEQSRVHSNGFCIEAQLQDETGVMTRKGFEPYSK